MLSKNDIKIIRSLALPKYRKKHQLFVAEGYKVINDLASSGLVLRRLFSLSDENYSNREVELVDERQMKQVSFLTNPSDSLALFQIPESISIQDFKSPNDIILGCEKIQDPGNFGTIIRLADWFGFNQLLCTPDCVDPYNPKVVQSSMGSLARVKIITSDIGNVADGLSEHQMISTDLGGEDIYESELPEKMVVWFGNESNGISEELRSLSEKGLKIPSHGGAESLNVSVSAGIVCAELRRRLSLEGK